MRRVINFRNVFVRAGFLPPTVARWVRFRVVVLGAETVACPDQGKDRFTHHVDALRVVDLARQFDDAVDCNDTTAFLSARADRGPVQEVRHGARAVDIGHFDEWREPFGRVRKSRFWFVVHVKLPNVRAWTLKRT